MVINFYEKVFLENTLLITLVNILIRVGNNYLIII